MICLLFNALRQGLMLVDASTNSILKEVLVLWNSSSGPLPPTKWSVSRVLRLLVLMLLILVVMVMVLLLKAACRMHLWIYLLVVARGRTRSGPGRSRLRHLHIVAIRRAQLTSMLLQLLPVLVIKIVDSIEKGWLFWVRAIQVKCFGLIVADRVCFRILGKWTGGCEIIVRGQLVRCFGAICELIPKRFRLLEHVIVLRLQVLHTHPHTTISNIHPWATQPCPLS